MKQRRITRLVPIFNWLPGYQLKWLKADLIAGLTVWALTIPESLGYAGLAGVPPENGLYAALAALIFFAIFSKSPHIVTGPSSTEAVLTGAIVLSVASSGSEEAIQIAATLAIMVGIFYIILGLLKAGWIFNFVSKVVLTGFIFGVVVDIIVGQIPHLLGISSGGENTWQKIGSILTNLTDTNYIALTIGIIALLILFILKEYAPKIPGALIVVVLGILTTYLFKLDQLGVEIVGQISTGLPKLALPDLEISRLSVLAVSAFGIVVVAFSESLGATQIFASKHKYEIDTDQEMIAQGAANAGAGLFQGFSVAGSFSKSAANDAAGAKTQMALLIQAVFVILTLLFLAFFFTNLPEAVLGAIVIEAVFGLIDIGEMRRFYKIRRLEFGIALFALVGVLTFGTIQGIFLGVILSLLLLIGRTSNPNMPELGREKDKDVFRNLEDNPENKTYEGLKIIRFDAPLFFATSNALRSTVKQIVRDSTPPVKEIILNLETVYFIDIQGADKLKETIKEMREEGVSIHLARVHANIMDFFRRSQVTSVISEDDIHRNIGGAVEDYLSRQQIED